MQLPPQINDVRLLDGRYPVKVIQVDADNVAFLRKRKRKPRETDLPGDPIQIVTIKTWHERTSEWKPQSNAPANTMNASIKSRRKARLPNRGAEQLTLR